MLDLQALLHQRIVKPEPKGTALEPELIAKCDPTAEHVYPSVAAIESETVFGAGTPYSRPLPDPDGLFFAIIDPRRVLNPPNPALFPKINDVDPADIDGSSS